jgi:energy-coupling factor transporter ATP-binding protein EcfA2
VRARVDAPPIVDVVGVIVTVPAPMFLMSTNQSEGKFGLIARGMETATDAALESVTNLPASELTTVYVVPVCDFTI